MSGITNKLKAYFNFLKEYPKYHNRIVLMQFLVSPSCVSDNITAENEDKPTPTKMMERIPILKELY